jgi:glycosyltransferase involved in cell wall biosynthesis
MQIDQKFGIESELRPSKIRSSNLEIGVRYPKLNPRCLAVIVPVFNEARTLDTILTCILAESCVCQVVIVDDGSTDETSRILIAWATWDERIQIRTHQHNSGKGAAIKTALQLITAPVVIIQDADLEYDPRSYDRLLQPIRDGEAEVVYGNRFACGRYSARNWWHYMGNRALTFVTNMVTGLHLTDEATGYKLFRREIFDDLILEENGFGFCPEVTVKISKLHFRIAELPITYNPRSGREGKKIRFSDGVLALYCLLRYTFHKPKVSKPN